ncbi:MAG TPA: hypothetical protein VLB01_05595 [Thermodesulfobacteriota bacterium]|nr:hypothetical protein [Thermodesulfobacteriota bacterium]
MDHSLFWLGAFGVNFLLFLYFSTIQPKLRRRNFSTEEKLRQIMLTRVK